jgi:SAM-dependent methyltransferase
MLDRIEQTRAVYDEIATEYASRIASELEGKPLDRALLDVFAMSIGTGPRVCDAGCGPGHVARYLRDRGVNVYGLDLSPAMVSEAIQRNPDIEFRTGDLTDLAGELSDLAGIIAFYSLIHLPRERVTPALRNICRHLRPNGLAFIAFHIGTGELHMEEWWGRSVSVDFTFFEVAEMREYVQQAGFAFEWVVEREPYAGVEHPTRRGYVLARRLDSVGTTAPPTSG